MISLTNLSLEHGDVGKKLVPYLVQWHFKVIEIDKRKRMLAPDGMCKDFYSSYFTHIKRHSSFRVLDYPDKIVVTSSWPPENKSINIRRLPNLVDEVNLIRFLSEMKVGSVEEIPYAIVQ
jgi:hypothetical protein